MLGFDPNTHAEEIPVGYQERNLDDLGVTNPPEGFVVPDWAGGEDDDDDSASERPSNSKDRHEGPMKGM